jgi:hypothetical protein
MGNLVAYSVNASSASDIVASVKFAAKNNIRLVIKNTGTEYQHLVILYLLFRLRRRLVVSLRSFPH